MKSLYLFFLLFFSLLISAQSSLKCSSFSYCSRFGPLIRFPFYVTNWGPRCGYPGFDLSCNNSQTFLRLPNNDQFVVTGINYRKQRLYISNPSDSCLANWLKEYNFSSGSLFVPAYSVTYNFFNCSHDMYWRVMTSRTQLMFCDKSNITGYEVLATNDLSLSLPCENNWSVSVPVSDYGYQSGYIIDIILTWREPGCGACEDKGGTCGFESTRSSSKIKCFFEPDSKNTGLSPTQRSILAAIGVPGFVCLIGFLCYLRNKRQAQSTNRVTDRDTTTPSITHQPAHILMGLDGPTINSYPETVIGESGRLPKPNDGMCSICLAGYLPKETLRSIPECNHYFHANCVDEWLKTNSTCPLCRNTPNRSSISAYSSVSMSPSSSTPLL